jgi:hypothetical protein
MISIPNTDRDIQDKVSKFMFYGWNLLSVEATGMSIKYTLGWSLLKGEPIYPLQID